MNCYEISKCKIQNSNKQIRLENTEIKANKLKIPFTKNFEELTNIFKKLNWQGVTKIHQ